MYSGDFFNLATIEGMLGAPGLKWHEYPPDVIPLWLADPDFPVAMEIKKALINAVHDEDLFYSNDLPTREAMAEKITRRNRIEATADDILITQGVIPPMWLAVRHACKAEDEVIVTDPMYHHFLSAQKVAGSKPVAWNLRLEEGYRFDIERLKGIVTPRTRLIFVCNPHNPAGRVMTEEELRGIADIAVDNEIAVMVDELWEDILFDGRQHITLASLSPEIERLTMTTWGFSKTFGVAGLRMGYTCATDEEMMTSLRMHSADCMRGTSNLARAAAPVMLDHRLDWWRRDIMAHLHKVRDLCYNRLDELPGVTYPELEGTYLMFPRFDYGKTSEELYEHMLNVGKLAFSAGTDYGSQGEGQLRMCIATSEAILNEVFDRMERALAKL
ncbi:MAG: pyridoxal phosphate-dependent aminotransferase [Candidatus Bathyarchaeota archaeon]|nr:MAG: pyridoxal phosphate-dependent aminotransferase [Candidatus Bathyarchaeota archaeon]